MYSVLMNNNIFCFICYYFFSIKQKQKTKTKKTDSKYNKSERWLLLLSVDRLQQFNTADETLFFTSIHIFLYHFFLIRF